MNKQELLNKIKELPDLTNDERAYLINLVNTKKKYGLVWEDKPEEVEEQLREYLPVLKEVKEKAILNDSNFPNHLIIEGDNLHALTSLIFTHEGKIDSMYFDPPYNTGNKSWRYNNDYVEKEDSFRHSKWLSFMKKRLKISKTLLSEDGLIAVTIDDYEVAPLILLLDEIFGEDNRIGILIIENNPRGRTTNKFFATCHEYALIYAKNQQFANLNHIPLNDEQKLDFNFEDKISPYRLLPFRRSGGLSTPSDRANSEFALYYSLSKKNIVAVGGTRVNPFPAQYIPECIYTLNEDGELVTNNVNEYLQKNQGDVYPIMPIDSSGERRVWRWSERENILLAAKNGDFNIVTKSGNFTVQLKDRIKEGRKAKTIWSNPKYDASSNGTVLIDTILNKRKVFDYPKSLYAVKDVLKIIENSKKSSPTFLDIFAGSGTTLHAILEMNAEDKKDRKTILVTNNENKIAEEVTYERNKRVIQGYSNSKNEKIDGYKNNNLRYYKTEFVGRENTLQNRKDLTRLATELLCIKEDCYMEQLINIKKTKFFYNNQTNLLVLYDDDIIPDAVQFIKNLDSTTNIKVYVFSMGSDPYKEDFAEVINKIELCPLPDAIYKAFRNILPKRQKNPQIVVEEDISMTDDAQLLIL